MNELLEQLKILGALEYLQREEEDKQKLIKMFEELSEE